MPAWRLSTAAEDDIVALLAYTQDRFGDTARRHYEVLLVTGLRCVSTDPECHGSAARPELGETVRSYHLRHARSRARTAGGWVRKPRHVLLYRRVKSGLVGIGRVLHDSMEVERHLPSQYGDE